MREPPGLKLCQKGMKSNTSVREALRWGIGTLKKAGVETPVLDAEVLLTFAVGGVAHESARRRSLSAATPINRSWLFAHPKDILSVSVFERYKKMIARRGRHEPVAYIVGYKEFYGLDFFVNRHVLVPRSETEVLVEAALLEVERCQVSGVRYQVLDVGTGSGAIAVAIAKNTPSVPPPSRGRIKVGGMQLFATDISAAALRVARKNARRHGVAKRIKFLRGNLMEPIIRNFLNSQFRNFVITANLPYLPTSEWRAAMPEVKKWEPRGALDGGKDGLKYYREMFEQFKLKVKSCKLHVTFLCEICPEQAGPFKKMARGFFPRARCEIVKDLAGRNRVVVVKM